MPPLVTLTTDFGTRDPYVAAMKGCIARIAPSARILDLTHEIAPQDITEAALFLTGAVPYFPAEAVHCIVVDPGVGTKRLPVAVEAGGRRFVCPDNGVLALLLRTLPLGEARHITNADCMRPAVSATFHGRDVFAPTAAKLAAGMPIGDVGPEVASLTQLDLPEPQAEADGTVQGEIVHIDRFGNCITNISREILPSDAPSEAVLPDRTPLALRETYGSVRHGEPLALFGSSGRLEIAVNGGDAADSLGLKRGDPVCLHG